jgi:pimeloyl-ACP methyl ester carboxylesterase
MRIVRVQPHMRGMRAETRARPAGAKSAAGGPPAAFTDTLSFIRDYRSPIPRINRIAGAINGRLCKAGVRMNTLKSVIVMLVVGYIAVVGLMYLAQRVLMYFPERVRTAPADAGYSEASESVLESEDGTKVIVWSVPPRESRPVIVYLHGNGGALRHRAERFKRLTENGYGLVALSYRGFGGSEGSPSEEGLIADGRSAYEFARLKHPQAPIVLWGESLGTGVATALAGEKPVGGMILEAPFTSTADIASATYPFVPVRLLMKDQFRSDERIGKVKGPILVMHGVRDRVVPIAFGERLFALAPAPKRFIRFANGAHEDLGTHGAVEAAMTFLEEEVRSK